MAEDFVDSFLDYTEAMPSPYLFRLWAGISAVAGALERRVWVRALPRPTYPNLYVLLVAAPGVGKGVIDEVSNLWRKVRRLHVAPDSVTSASMLDSLIEADRKIIHEGRLLFEYHSLLIASEEFGVLLPAHDLEFLSRLNRIFTNPDVLRVRRKYIKEEIQITNPMLNILAGTQPGFLATLLPEEAWSMGFTQRLMLIHASTGPKVDLFGEFTEHETKEAHLVRLMESLASMHGQLQWEPEAAASLQEWHAQGGPPRPSHTRLVHYLNRRTQFLLKLMTISSASRGDDHVVRSFDFERGMAWLLAAEHVMPDVFREMTQKSDIVVIQEMTYFLWQIFTKGNKQPIHEQRIIAFLSTRVPSEKVLRIMEIAERSNLLIRSPENMSPPSRYFIPKPREISTLE